jgi:hypothetical protein
MKTAEEYLKRYANGITGAISTDPDYEHSYYLFADGLKKILAEHDKEIIAIIDEMIEEQRELALFWHPTEERYIAERYEDAISKINILTQLKNKLGE